MDRVTIRQLRNDVSRIVRRASAGERLIITSNGVAVAEIRPLEKRSVERTIEDMIAAGELIAPRRRATPRPATPIRFSGSRTSDEILQELRERG
ncbi:MAG: type II toxin-antitoxin system prevent-host-death family antitoxin [Chloroflexota bacterium]|nr:type II toxin-antitoxin system prevent-host-death family antitoxin [Chloroflexota bacterium]